MKIAFVCLGNICRSPMAKWVCDARAKERGLQGVVTDSFATSDEEYGNPMHAGTVRILQKHGVPFGAHRAKQLTAADYGKFDLFVGMESRNERAMRNIFRKDPQHKIVKLLDFSSVPRNIVDPWYTGNFECTYADVVEGVEGLLDAIAHNV